MKVTAVEISRRPVSPETIYVIFDKAEDATKFAADVEKDYNFILDKIYEEDSKKFDWPFGRSREIYANVSLSQLKSKIFGTGWR